MIEVHHGGYRVINIDLRLRSKAAPEEPVTDLRLTGGPDSPRDVRLTLYLADAARELRPLRPQPDTHCHVMIHLTHIVTW